MRRTLIAALTLVTAAGCSTASVESDPLYPPAPAGSGSAILPAGTDVEVELDQTLSANDNRTGDRFSATVKDDISRNGQVVVPAGSKVTGIITGVDGSSRIGDQAAIRVGFESIEVDGRTYAFNADVQDVDVGVTDRANAGGVKEKTAAGAATGVVLGAIIGGSLKDALIGGLLGAGAGTIISLGTGDIEASLPKGTDLTLRTTTRVAAR